MLVSAENGGVHLVFQCARPLGDGLLRRSGTPFISSVLPDDLTHPTHALVARDLDRTHDDPGFWVVKNISSVYFDSIIAIVFVQ